MAEVGPLEVSYRLEALVPLVQRWEASARWVWEQQAAQLAPAREPERRQVPAAQLAG